MPEQCVLFPVDIDDSTEVLLPVAKDLLAVGVKEVRLLHVIRPVDVLAMPGIIEQRGEIFRRYRERLLGYGIPQVRGEVVVGTPWTEIANRAKSADLAFILMGSQGKGLLERVFLGSQTENVLYHTESSLFIIRIRTGDHGVQLAHDHPFVKILYATDLSTGSRKGIPFIEKMAGPFSHLTIAYVEDIRHFEYASPKTMQEIRSSSEETLGAMRTHFLQAGFGQVDLALRQGNAVSELLHLIEADRPSLLVLGAKGSYGVAERVLGGVADTLIHRAPVHILIAR